MWLCVCCSYKEESDDATESDDLIEVEMTEADYEREAAETIERVLRHRVGRKGGKLPWQLCLDCDLEFVESLLSPAWLVFGDLISYWFGSRQIICWWADLLLS